MTAESKTRTMILVNPRAREGEVGEKWPELERQLLGALGEGEAQVEFTSATDHGEAAVRRHLKAGVQRVVVVGGDGTVSAAVQGFFEKGSAVSKDAVLAVMPAGRGDDFFKVLAGRRSLSSADAWKQGLDLLRNGKPGPLDLARVSWIRPGVKEASAYDFILTNLTSFGLSGLVVKRVRERAGALGKTRLGKSGWAYVLQVLTGQALYKPIPVEVRIDGQEFFKGPLFMGFVMNGYYNAGGTRWSDTARVDDGILDVLLMEPRGQIAQALTSARMLSGNWRGVDKVHVSSGKKIDIRVLGGPEGGGERGFPFFELDGEQPEPSDCQGVEIEILPAAIRVLK